MVDTAEFKVSKNERDGFAINEYLQIMKHATAIEKILKKNKKHVELLTHTVSDDQFAIQWIFNRKVIRRKK